MLSYAFIIAGFLCWCGSASEAHWGYPDWSENEEFPKWGGICDTGKRQSPINLSLREAVKGIYGKKLKGDNYDKAITSASMVNTGHSVQLSDFDITLKLEGGPLPNDFILEQIHFHWWSEHTIDNVRYPFEMHMVHRNSKYENMTVATQNLDGLSVLGVLYHASMERNMVIDSILTDFVQVMSFQQVNNPVKIKMTFKITDLLPEISNYITYQGSLTTPSCAESVTWIVVAHTFPIAIDEVDAFKSLEYDQGKLLANNYRAIQKINNRAIVIAANDGGRDAAATNASTSTSLLALIIAAWLVKYYQ